MRGGDKFRQRLAELAAQATTAKVRVGIIEQANYEWPKQAAALLEANSGDVRQTLELMGEGVKGQIVETIQAFREPPNAAATVKQKGFDKPLIDTWTLWRSIDYEVTDE